MAANPTKIIIPPTTPGASAPVALDWRKTDFGATVQVYTSGAASFGLEYTLDDIQTVSNPRWMFHPGMPSGTSASGSALLTTPCCAVRLNIASNAAAVEFRVLA
jgi:hypothetical protein